MKTNLVVASCVLAGLVSACGKNASQKAATDGGLSGGGGYADLYAAQILKAQSTKLAGFVDELDDSTFAVLPAGWNKRRVAGLVRGIRENPSTERKRDGKELMFDYGVDESGPYIEALKPYYLSYGALPVDADKDYQTMRQLWVRLGHEVGHHLGYGEATAEHFGSGIANAVERQMIVCTGAWKLPSEGHEDIIEPLAAVINTVTLNGAMYSVPNEDTAIARVIAAGFPDAKLKSEAFSVSNENGFVIYGNKTRSYILKLNPVDPTNSSADWGNGTFVDASCQKNSYVITL
jgi:hypothetical protein